MSSTALWASLADASAKLHFSGESETRGTILLRSVDKAQTCVTEVACQAGLMSSRQDPLTGMGRYATLALKEQNAECLSAPRSSNRCSQGVSPSCSGSAHNELWTLALMRKLHRS